MSTQLEHMEIKKSLAIISETLPLVDEAERKFRNARGWGIVDILGGGFFTDLIKHSQLSSASDIMGQINILLQQLQRELSDISFPADYRMNDATFATLADFLFDGILADAYMQSKIISSLNQIRELKNRLMYLQNRLYSMTNV